MLRTLRRALAALLLLAAPAQAVYISVGDGNLTVPADDPGWANVGRKGVDGGGIPNGSGAAVVYLGNRWVLTASHISWGPILLNGVAYYPDTSTIVDLDPDYDLILWRLTVDPGLPSIPLISSPPTVGEAVVMVGACFSCNHLGTAACSGHDGFNVDGPRTLRWGTNEVSDVHPVGYPSSFETIFNAAVSNNEAQASSGDSGGPVFVKRGGVWQVAGIMVSVRQCNLGFFVAEEDVSIMVDLSVIYGVLNQIVTSRPLWVRR